MSAIPPLAWIILAVGIALTMVRLVSTRRLPPTDGPLPYEVRRSCPLCSDWTVMCAGTSLAETTLRANDAVNAHRAADHDAWKPPS